ncbi:hypothetical protein DMP14_24350 [Pseudonocardia sp. Ae707_Ps2]
MAISAVQSSSHPGVVFEFEDGSDDGSDDEDEFRLAFRLAFRLTRTSHGHPVPVERGTSQARPSG